LIPVAGRAIWKTRTKRLGSGGSLGLVVIFGWTSCLEVLRGCGKFDLNILFGHY
jgi:hypothetical protein